MSKHFSPALLGVGLVVASVTLTACGGGPVGGGPSANGAGAGANGTVTTVINSDPSGFNPFMYRTTNDAVLETFLYDSLLRLDDSNTLVPALASSWEAKSATSYSFSIRDDATCSDGTSITGKTVADSLSVLADRKTASAVRALVFGPGDATITAQGNTVNIDLSQPYSLLPRGLSMAQSGIVCPAGLVDAKKLNTETVAGAYSGPYVLKSAKPGVGYELELRKGYNQWPQYKTELKGEAPATVKITVSADPSTVANKLISGDLDLGGITNDNIARFQNSQDVTVKQSVANWVYVVFNQRPGSPFHNNPELRKAVAQAVSRQSFSNAVTNGRGPLLSGLADEGAECALTDDSLLVPTNREEAAKKLSGVDLKMVGYNGLGTNGSGGVAIQEALSAAGAKVDLHNTDDAAWATTVTQQTSKWDLTVMGGLTPLLQSMTRVMGTPAEEGGRSISGVRLPGAEQALGAALAADSEGAKCQSFQDAQRELLKDTTVVPLITLPKDMVIRKGVDLQVFNGDVDYKTLRITKQP